MYYISGSQYLKREFFCSIVLIIRHNSSRIKTATKTNTDKAIIIEIFFRILVGRQIQFAWWSFWESGGETFLQFVGTAKRSDFLPAFCIK